MREDMPAFLGEQLLSQYGGEEYARIEAGLSARRLVTLRVNRLKSEPETVRRALGEAGVACETVPWSEDALVLPGAREEALIALPLYARGDIYLQSLSSMIPPLVLGAREGENLLDMAAAPGGKTTQIAALTGNRAMITACERHAARAERLKFNLSRQGASRVTVMNIDARQLSDLFSFDRILLDAPCSGSGTLSLGAAGRQKARFSRELLARTVKTQNALLDKALRLLRPGCEMVYSTCSLLAEENEGVLRRALARGGAEVVPIDAARFPGVPMLPCGVPGTLCVCPDARYEGFFVAKLRKAGK